ncbi:MAG: amino acid decarboxylase [Phycisphaerae bacterium]|nr:amino acid decarboxylase [Gemmatimonadaceae bacterium]
MHTTTPAHMNNETLRAPLDAPALTQDAPGLDPADWHAFTQVAHRAVDEMATHLSGIRNKPAWQPIPDSVRQALSVPVPRAGVGDAAAYDSFTQNVLPYPGGNLHPRFWGWVMGTGVPSAMVAEFLAAGLNPNCGGLEQSPGLVEAQVISWMSELLLDDASASGVLVSSASVANLVALTTALHARAGFDVRGEGLQGAPHKLACYGSVETHSWIKRTCSVLGLGENAFRAIPSDAHFRIDIPALKAAIHADRAKGVHPFCVIGTAGTVNTGATDDLDALADLCEEEHLWFHVDGAFGALARLSPALKPMLTGIERADSLAFDLHKWGYLPYGIAAVLIRDAAAHLSPFATTPSYLQTMSRGPMTTGVTYGDRGLDLSRGFLALKAWFTLTSHGVDAIARNVEGNVAQAQYLGKRVSEADDLELLAPVALNLVNFRYAPANAMGEMPSESELDALNVEILQRLQERGIAVPSSTRVHGKFAIRVAITNHRTRFSDFDVLVQSIQQLGAEVMTKS